MRCIDRSIYLPDDASHVEMDLYAEEQNSYFPYHLRLLEKAPEFR
jgi:hypothetical protein